MRFTALVLAVFLAAAPAFAVDDAHRKQADDAIAKGVAYLRKAQKPDGRWTVVGRQADSVAPAITALALTGLLDRPDIKPSDPQVAAGLKYLLSEQKPDGGIYHDIVEIYNTSIALSALAKVKDQPGVADAIKKAQDYLHSMQWSEDGRTPVKKDDPRYGGWGYGGGGPGRPDITNTVAVLQGLYDSETDTQSDPAFQRAVIFLTRLQGVKENDKFADKIANDGGFIYAPMTTATRPALESKAAPAPPAGTPEEGTSRIVTYGSVSYAGFKSYLYANLDRNDPRVKAVLDWASKHYVLDHNPGMPEKSKLEGHYYYLLAFAKALQAWGKQQFVAADGSVHDWQNDLIDTVVKMQQADGSWVNPAPRWMENDPTMITAYTVIALEEATRPLK